MKLKVRKLHKDAKVPTLGSEGAACYDVFSTEDYTFVPQDSRKISTGLAYEVPRGYELEVRPRGSLGARQLIILNSPGTLDSDYRGELFILLRNISSRNIKVSKGDRIAQVKLNPVIPLEFEESEELSKTERGGGSLGSTGQ